MAGRVILNLTKLKDGYSIEISELLVKIAKKEGIENLYNNYFEFSMKKEKTIIELENQIDAMSKKINQLINEKNALFSQIHIYQSDCKHYSSKVRELEQKNEAMQEKYKEISEHIILLSLQRDKYKNQYEEAKKSNSALMLHYQNEYKELANEYHILKVENTELQGIIEIMKQKLYDKVPEVNTIMSVDYDPNIQMFENKITTNGAFEEVKL